MKKLLIGLLLLNALPLWATPTCEATYDEIGITHLKVSSEKDYYYCFGYHHAKDRGWQMDYFRRFAYGMNAEVLGYEHIKNDFMMRLLDLPALADRLFKNFPQEQIELLKAYSVGANEGFKIGKKADEFIQFGYEPSNWEPVHSIAVMLLQSFDQTKKTFFFDIKEQEKFEKYPNADQLFDENKTPWLTTILKDGEYSKKIHSQASSQSSGPIKLWAYFPQLFGEQSGSNNWVVDKNFSEKGFAILANDPHLDLKTPLFWYWIHLKGPERSVIGASLPGLPFVASGTNGDVSWGLTNSYLNSADSIKITDLKKDDLTSSRPVIWFKLGFLKLPFFFKSMQKYKDIYPVLPIEVGNIDPIVLRWSGYNLETSEITPMFNLHQGKNVNEVDDILSQIGVPSWNYVFADTNGDIGYRMVGKTYKNEDNFFGVRELSSEEFLNPAFLSPDERPHLLKPKRSFIATANNQHWPSDALYNGGRSYSLSFRANRIEEKIKSVSKHSIESTRSIQCDLFVTDAQYFIPSIQKYIPDFLKDWDMLARHESKELGLYRRLMDLMMDEWDVNESALYLLLENLDDKKMADIQKLHRQAIKEVSDRKWSELALLPFEHLSGDKDLAYSPVLSALGDEHTVGPGTTRWNEDKGMYEHFSGASMRMIVEMSKPVKLHLNLPGKNRDYQNASTEDFTRWHQCQYFEVAF